MHKRLLPGSLLAPLLGLLISACDKPPASAYYKAQAAAQGAPIGKNTTGEECTLVDRGSNGADIFCGAWRQPSARIRPATPGAGALLALATSSGWRAELDTRFNCGEPKTESSSAIVMQCTWCAGSWPQIAWGAQAGSGIWLADGTPASYPTIQRAVAQLSGGAAAPAVSGPPSAAMASYLASSAFSAGDIAAYETLMNAGLQANLAGRPDQAEEAYRKALQIQEKQQGRDSPAGAPAMMALALQLSNQGRFDEAKNLLDHAESVLKVPNAAELDPNGQARLALYRGVHLLNLNNPKAALPYFQQAEARYRLQAPDAQDVAAAPAQHMYGSTGMSLGDLVSGGQAYATLVEKEALLGVLEARRNRAIAQRLAGDPSSALKTAESAKAFARANGLVASLYTARVYRTAGTAAEAASLTPVALEELDQSVRAFQASQPRARPTAETELIHAAALSRLGKAAEALAQCRAATALLRDTKDGVDFERMQPCLDIFAAQAKAAGANGQALLAEMFGAAQLTRGSVTDEEIRRTAVRLAASDPRVSDAIRQQQDAEKVLADLMKERDGAAEGPQDPPAQARIAELDKKIGAARAKLEEADGTVQAAAPNYQQLIQQPVEPTDMFAALKPNEAFVSITLSTNGGWTFVMRDGRIGVARIDRGTAQVADLVKRMRASIEPNANNQVPEFDIAVARELYDVVLGGVAPSLEGASAVTIAPSGPLLSIPFEALLTGPANPHNLSDAPFLVRKYVITHVPAAANFVKLRAAGASAARNGWFGFGDFRPITREQALRTYPGERCRSSAEMLAGLPRLEGTQAELGLASRIFGAAPADVRAGQAFTVQTVKSLPLKDYKIVHFATHGLLPSELACQDEPAIVTSAPAGAADAKGALLTASDIAGLKLDADAVILSACNSGGGGSASAGESLAGLARSFFYAGARALMVTHWTVDDETATYLVAKTLARLQKEPAGGLAEALRTAQIAYLDRADIEPPQKHPYYWAPFVLVGEGGGHAVTAQNLSPAGQARL